MKEPILMRLGYNGRSIWWIPGQPKPDPVAIDAREKRFNAFLNRNQTPKLVRTSEGWTEDGILVSTQYDLFWTEDGVLLLSKDIKKERI